MGGIHIYKKILWSVIAVVVIGIGVFAAVTYMSDDDNSSQAEDQENKHTNEDSHEDDHTETNEQQTPNKNLDPFKQTYTQEELTDEVIRDFIHKMSHQKVKAEDKWGFFEITDERLDWLQEALEHKDVMKQLTDGDVYLDILSKWQADDFSNVDQDHNTIWRLQGGTIGKATGTLSEEEEKNYIENTSESK